MESLLLDLRYALRALLRAPGFAAAAIATLALGIGATTAIFSVVDGVLLRPAPFTAVDRLAMVWETDTKSGTTREPSAVQDFVDFQQRSKQFASLAAFMPTEVSVTRGGADPARLAGLQVSSEFLSMVGVQPIAGRLLDGAETRATGPRAALISEDLWETQFDRSPAAIGQTIRLDDVSWTVVGVLPRAADFGTLQVLGAAAYGRGFAQRGGRTRVDVWMGLRADSATTTRDNHPIFVAGRLAPGATAATAQQEMTAITADLERAYPSSNVARGAFVEPMETVVFGNVQTPLLVLLAAVALVLLVACANVANLLLVRASGRVRELTVRVALGAGSARLARQFMMESAVLTLAGATAGVVLAMSGLDLLLAIAPGSIPRVGAVGIDTRVLAVTLAVSVVVALGFGALPILQLRRRNVGVALRGVAGRGSSAGREQSRSRSALVVTELAMAVVLMVGAGLLIKSFWRLERVDAGFAVSGILKAEYQLPDSRYPRDFAKWPIWAEQQRFDNEVLRRVAALPGVESVALAASHPLDAGFTSSVRVVGREAEGTAADWPEPAIRVVTPGYFGTMGIAAAAGRVFASGDAPGAPPVMVINDAAAKRFFAGREPLGQQIRLWGTAWTVVGVIGNERFRGLAEAPAPGVYLALGQVPSSGGSHSILVRTAGDPRSLAGALQSVIRDLDPALPLYGVESLRETLAGSVAQPRFTMMVLGAFAAVSLLLAVIGVYSVLSYAVSQRTREIGIRMALGADARGVRTLVVGEGALLMLLGVGVGLLGALGVSRVLSTMLFGVGTRDPMTFVIAAATLGAVALLAAYVPARRASRLDPMAVLRTE